MARRKTIGTSPLDAVIPEQADAAPAETAPARPPKKVRATFQLPEDMIEEVRDLVYASPELTMTSVMHDALSDYLKKWKRKHGDIPHRGDAPLKTGRPVKAP